MSRSNDAYYLSEEARIHSEDAAQGDELSPENFSSLTFTQGVPNGARQQEQAFVLGQELSSTGTTREFTVGELVSSEEVAFSNGYESPAADAPLVAPTQVAGEGLGLPGALRESLTDLVRLIANITESYTTTIFLADQREQVLSLVAAHTLSRDLLPDARIGFGCGLIGWTAENAVRISVCPFEHDATTLLYYRRDQALKSFIAVPIIDRANNLRGVIACDSKKTYAFAKLTEKILLDCAAQAATLIELHLQLGRLDRKTIAANDDLVLEFLDRLRSKGSERYLLQEAAELPQQLVDRDALVVITTDEPGSSSAAFYSTSNQARVGNRLLELVCRHKKIICSERSVQALSGDDSQRRSFLSIPFRVLKREAGSINLLSRPFETFSPMEIAALEKVAQVIGKELELHRLREKLVSSQEAAGLLRWEQFVPQARAHLQAAAQRKQALCLVRIAVTNILDIENFLGVEAAQIAVSKVMRLVEQVKGSSALASYLYGNHILVLSEKGEAERMMGRFTRLIDRVSLQDEAVDPSRAPAVRTAAKNAQSKIGELLAIGTKHVAVLSAREGSSLEDLTARSRHYLEVACQSKSVEVMAHAGNW